MSSRLPSVRPRQLIRVLEQKGWRLARSKGSHHHFTHPDSRNIVTVAVHAKDIKRGTLSGNSRRRGHRSHRTHRPMAPMWLVPGTRGRVGTRPDG